MKRIHIKMENEITKKLQNLDFELAARRNIITTMMNQHLSDSTDEFLSSSVFTSFYNEYKEMNAEWEKTKNAVQSTCFPAWMRQYDFTWNLNTFTLTFEINLPESVSDDELKDYDVEYI